LEGEVEDFLGRKRYERQEGSVGYRNGYGKRRKVALGKESEFQCICDEICSRGIICYAKEK
jgi:hypothetical protein